VRAENEMRRYAPTSLLVSAVVRLAVDARDLASDTRGIGRYMRAILRRLVKREDLDVTLLVFAPFAFRRRKALREALGSDRFDIATQPKCAEVVWHPANGTFFASRARSVATIHDAVPFRFPVPDRGLRARQQTPFLRSVREAKRIIAVSEFDRSEIEEIFGVPTDRIEVIYHGVEPFFGPGAPEQNLPPPLRARPYFLFVGDPEAEPRKNFALLQEAYRDAFPETERPALVVVGAARSIEGVFSAGISRSDAAGQGDAFLRDLYRGALALCMPSYYETFGMPMIEAMACGTPVVASQASCLPEIGSDAALFAPPNDASAWSTVLRRIANDEPLRARLSRAAVNRAGLFDWDESARRHAEIFARQ